MSLEQLNNGDGKINLITTFVGVMETGIKPCSGVQYISGVNHEAQSFKLLQRDLGVKQIVYLSFPIDWFIKLVLGISRYIGGLHIRIFYKISSRNRFCTSR